MKVHSHQSSLVLDVSPPSCSQPFMLIIGIVGGIASGKSVVSACFKARGAFVLDADRAGHEVLRLREIRDQVRNIWGDSVFQTDGQVDRRKLGQIVFALQGGETELAKLEAITHPLIKKRLSEQIEQLRQEEKHPVAILDAPVLFKAGWDGFCDLILFVESSDENRLNRATQRGWTRSEFEQREASQVSLELKRSRSNYVVVNNDSLESVDHQVDQIWSELKTT